MMAIIKVLILIVVEDGLVPDEIRMRVEGLVLILIVVEDGLVLSAYTQFSV